MNVTFCWSQCSVSSCQVHIYVATKALWIHRPSSETVRHIRHASADLRSPCSRMKVRWHRLSCSRRRYQDIRAGSSWYGFRPNANAVAGGCQTATWQPDRHDLMHRITTEQYLSALYQTRELQGCGRGRIRAIPRGLHDSRGDVKMLK